MASITLPEGAAIAKEELKRIADALAALEKDPHAPRELQVRVTVHVHNEYPKHLYRGKASRIVQNADEEDKARADGYGELDPEEFYASEEK